MRTTHVRAHTRLNQFQNLIADAKRSELLRMQKELKKELRLSETAIEEGYEKNE